ncbi:MULTISPECIES: TolC family protein [unclassified Dyella]|uniref:TolC family protein n=1 Tax=unclassified Dyella TaxID=2634549 RepID=UPI000C83243B|nr:MULTISPECIES: TolC family protein [unclassified Dyella]MDR3444615.1 TolC family protein [Dyella sp.]PMQ05674.1 Outer membrane protein OprM [Dyella sp. AD56]
MFQRRNNPDLPNMEAAPRRDRPLFTSSLLAFSLVVLAGCSARPLPELKPPLPDAWRNAPAGVAPPSADLRGWWQALGDPALDDLVNRALQNNLDVAQAAERLRAARTANHHSRDGYLPSLHGRTNDVIDPDTTASYFVAGFDALWELPLFGAWQSSKRASQGQENSAKAALRGVRVSLVAEVSRRWIELRSAQEQARLLTGIRDAQKEKLRLVQVREQLKLAPPIDVAKAQADLARAEAALTEPQQAINASAQQLALLLGQPEPDPAWLTPGPQPRLGEWQLTAAPADMLRARPEIASAEADVLRAAGELGMSRADIWPHIGLGASLQWSANILSNYRVHTGEAISSFGPIIDVPLFDWGQRVAAAHVKDHQLKAAVYAYRQAVLQGVAEAETAMGDLEQLRTREDASQRVTQALDGSMAALHKRAELNLGSGLDVQDGLIDNQRAQLELVSAIAARDLAYVSLYKALGGAPMPKPPMPAKAPGTGSTD